MIGQVSARRPIVSHLPPPGLQLYSAPLCLAFLHKFGGLNEEPYACMTTAITIEPSPQPHFNLTISIQIQQS